MTNPPKLTPSQYQEILKSHPDYDSSNLFTWRDTWKVFASVTVIFIAVSGVVSAALAYYVGSEIERAVSTSEKAIHSYVDTRCPKASSEYNPTLQNQEQPK